MRSENESGLKALLVDDERLARKRFIELLEAHPEVNVVGQAHDLASARALVQGLAPDVVFLDIDLSSTSGFDLLPDLPSATEVVFVTAHNTFAVRAFEANALDYLLKPVAPERLADSVNRLLTRTRLGPERLVSGTEAPAERLAPTDPLLVRDGQTWRRMEPCSVLAIQGEGTYTRVYSTEGESFLVLRPLKEWMEMLPEDHFARVSRSLLVNLKRVERLETVSRDRANLFLAGRSQALELGRVASKRLRQILSSGA